MSNQLIKLLELQAGQATISWRKIWWFDLQRRKFILLPLMREMRPAQDLPATSPSKTMAPGATAALIVQGYVFYVEAAAVSWSKPRGRPGAISVKPEANRWVHLPRVYCLCSFTVANLGPMEYWQRLFKASRWPRRAVSLSPPQRQPKRCLRFWLPGLSRSVRYFLLFRWWTDDLGS